jgi:plasmid stabilization system protein ParE
MALKVVWTDEAYESLEDIINYLESNWSEIQIRRFFARLEESLASIAEAPKRHKDSLRKPGVKEYQHSPQTTIFYSFDEVTVFVLRIWANRRNLENL